MSPTMHDLLTSAVESRERSLAPGTAFADGHGAPVRRTIQVRRVTTYAGTGTVAAVVAASAGYGVQAWSASDQALAPAGGASASANVPSQGENLATKVSVTLVKVPIDDSTYPPGETTRSYVYYASLGAIDMVPFPASGIWYPGIPDVPSDAVIVSVDGDASGYDLDAPGSENALISAFPAWTNMYNFGGDNRGPYGSHMGARTYEASAEWDVVGTVSSTTPWGIHYFLLDGNAVTDAEGRSNPAAIEVTAMFDPQNAS